MQTQSVLGFGEDRHKLPKFLIFRIFASFFIISLIFFGLGSAFLPIARAVALSAPVVVVSPGSGSASLVWSAPTDTGGGVILNYMVLRGASQSVYTSLDAVLPASTTNYADVGLTNGTAYYFAVVALNTLGQTSISNQASATPQAASVTTTSPAATPPVSPPPAAQNPPTGLTYPSGGSSLAYPGNNTGTQFANGTLLLQNGVIYLVYKGKKSGFVSYSVFQDFGFNADNTIPTQLAQVADTGYVINVSKTSHPWGSWLSHNGAVYFRHQDGLIPVPSTDALLSNGGRNEWVVPANSYDLTLKTLSAMAVNDPRLQ